MDEVIITTTARIGVLGCSDFDFAISLRDGMYNSGEANGNHLWLLGIEGFAGAVEHVERITE